MVKTAIIAGSSGLVGKSLLNLLLEEPNYSQVISIVRQASGISHPRLQELVINFNEMAEALKPIKNGDDVYCCLGTTMKKAGNKVEFRKVDYTYSIALAEWALKIKARNFLCISAMGANPSSKIFYNRIKGEIEREIGKIKIPSVVFFRPSLLIGKREDHRRGEVLATVLANLFSFLFKGILKNYKAIPAEKVAAAMLKEAQNGKLGVRIIMSGEMG